MPYKIDGDNVLHQVNGKWKVKQHCDSHASAVATMRLLQAIEHNPDFKPRKNK